MRWNTNSSSLTERNGCGGTGEACIAARGTVEVDSFIRVGVGKGGKHHIADAAAESKH